MTDIDFDELDKAVNSALKPKLEKTADTSSAPEPTEPTLPDAPAVETEVVVEPSRAGAAVKPPQRRSLVSPASQRSGRFMDMVHPSSDMAGEKKLQPTPKLKLVPTDETLTAKGEENESAAPSAVEVTQTEEATEKPKSETVEPKPASTPDVQSPEPGVSQYPDPLDLAAKQDDSDADEEADGPAAVEVDAAPTPTPAEPTGETPFIADAKVEKRPLGGFTLDAPEEISPLAEETDTGAVDTESQLPPESVLPEALQSDVVAVESDTAINEPVAEFNPDDLKHAEPEVETAAQPAEKTTVTPPLQPAIAQSIPQQYQSAPAEADDTLRPVFDTQEYHQPLIPASATHKSHTWVFVLLILALLAVGGALGYFAFVSGL